MRTEWNTEEDKISVQKIKQKKLMTIYFYERNNNQKRKQKKTYNCPCIIKFTRRFFRVNPFSFSIISYCCKLVSVFLFLLVNQFLIGFH